MIREEALLPTNVPGEFKKIQEICVPLWGIIVDTFDDNDLRALRRKRNISWQKNFLRKHIMMSEPF